MVCSHGLRGGIPYASSAIKIAINVIPPHERSLRGISSKCFTCGSAIPGNRVCDLGTC